MTIKAIETAYAGCRFRSRLEARWAVAFDHMGIPWEYEPEGFEVGYSEYGGDYYLPDFYLPQTKTWVEVKGSADAFDFQLLANTVDWRLGLPGTEDSLGTTRGLLLLGPIPRSDPWTSFPLLQHKKGGYCEWMSFNRDGTFLLGREHITSWPNDRLPDPYFDASWGEQDGTEWVEWVRDMWDKYNERPYDSILANKDPALVAARSARFEHGECG
ncbi:hypothetical protein AB0G86_25045 [Streptomyces scabiei]|uniref:hypothetical protein n=1 Tax=Streptomyces scabiei TaxID=1930 RepID=UPI00340CBDDE